MSYRCVAYGCEIDTGSHAKIMCRPHWMHVSMHIRGDLTTRRRPGAWDRQTAEYRHSVGMAVRQVWRAERERRDFDVCSFGEASDDIERVMRERDRSSSDAGVELMTFDDAELAETMAALRDAEASRWRSEGLLLVDALEAACRLRDAVEAQDMGLTLPSSMETPPEPGSYADLLRRFDAAVGVLEKRTGRKVRGE